MPNTWDEVFRSKKWGSYAPQPLLEWLIVSGWCARAAREPVHVLELGCATGATTKALADAGFYVTGIDGSIEAHKQAKINLGGYNNVDLFCRDFGDIPHTFPGPDGLPFSTIVYADWDHKRQFDLVIDVCSLQHNLLDETRNIANGLHWVMKEGAELWSMMVANGTTRDIYANLPYTHFATEQDVKLIFRPFEPLFVHQYTRSTFIDNPEDKRSKTPIDASWRDDKRFRVACANSLIGKKTSQIIHWIVTCRKNA